MFAKELDCLCHDCCAVAEASREVKQRRGVHSILGLDRLSILMFGPSLLELAKVVCIEPARERARALLG